MDYLHIGPAPVPDDARAVQIPMRDGVLLAADVYHSQGTSPRPVILVRLPYDKDGLYCFMPEVARHLAARDYVVVVQDVRGKYRSEGATEFGIHEVEDGYDTLEWVTRQDWCDGSVVMWGDSYFGMTQIAAAASGHPALKAIAPRVTGSQLATVVPHADGTVDVDQTSRRVYFASHYVDRGRYEWEPDWSARPLADTFEAFFSALGRRSGEYDHDLVAPSTRRPLAIAELVAAAPVPALYTIGWFDNCAVWSWHDVEALLADDRWRDAVHLRLEGIDHENYRFADAPIAREDELMSSPAARARLLPQILDPALDFFDHWLGRGAGAPARVTYEVCHEGWRTAESWPPPQAAAVSWHAEAGDVARRGRLIGTAPSASGEISWLSDGEDLVPSAAMNPFAMVFELHDLGPIAEREDVAVIESDVLASDLVLAGPVGIDGRLVSDQVSTDLFVRLLDVDADGVATMITRGQVHLEGLDAAQGEATVRVGMLHAGYRVAAGHRLRLHLASTDHPEFILNPGDGSDPWQAKSAAHTVTRLATGGDAGLRLSLTVLPVG